MDATHKLYFGDNLKILREYVPDASVDLIYLDPPFNSSATYNVLFEEKSGEESTAQIMAFEDTWEWSKDAEAVYPESVESGPRNLADLMQGVCQTHLLEIECAQLITNVANDGTYAKHAARRRFHLALPTTGFMVGSINSS